MSPIKDLKEKIAIEKGNVSALNRIYEVINNEYKGKYRPHKE